MVLVALLIMPLASTRMPYSHGLNSRIKPQPLVVFEALLALRRTAHNIQHRWFAKALAPYSERMWTSMQPIRHQSN